jgi:excisionase family DNA binding protein
MTHFTLYIELDTRNPAPEKIEGLRDLAEQGKLHPAVGTSVRGYLDATVTLQADSLQQAVFVGVATVQQLAGATALRVDAMTEAEFDARLGEVPIPELIGVTDASKILGLSRQRVLQMVDEGKLAGIRVGTSIALTRAEVTARAAKTDT